MRQTPEEPIMRPLIGYVRVSTSKQGKSGLGIEAQQEVLSRFAEAEGFELLRVFVEVETGKGSDALERTRPTSCRSSERFKPPLRTTFWPLVPEASRGRRGLFSHTSTPCTKWRPTLIS